MTSFHLTRAQVAAFARILEHEAPRFTDFGLEPRLVIFERGETTKEVAIHRPGLQPTAYYAVSEAGEIGVPDRDGGVIPLELEAS